MNDIVSISNLNREIKGKRILDNISINVKNGSIFSLVGHNGAGKSTLIKILLGLENNYSGNIRLFNSTNLEKERSRIGSVFDNMNLPTHKTGKQYLKEICYICGASINEEILNVSKFVGAQEYIDNKIGTYSYGMRQRLSLAGALIGDPDLILLDEPFNGIDPNGMKDMRLLLSDLHKKGVTILVSSHILTELIKISTDYGVITKGRISCSMTSEELCRTTLQKKIYKVEDQKYSLSELEATASNLLGIPFGDDSLCVLGKKIPDLNIFNHGYLHSDPTLEDKLLWYMSGKEMLNEPFAES